MKRIKSFANILFWITLFSPLLAFGVASLIGEVDIFGISGTIRYSWIMFLFIPFGILSIIIGVWLKKGKQKYKKNLIIAIVCVPILITFGSYRFIFANVFSYDIKKVGVIEEKMNLDLPNNIKIATAKTNSYDECFLKIVDEEERIDFENMLETNPLWQTELSSKIKSLLPIGIQVEVERFNYFLFYNLTNNEYNVYPSNGEYNCMFIAYNSKKHSFIALDEFILAIN